MFSFVDLAVKLGTRKDDWQLRLSSSTYNMVIDFSYLVN